MLFLFPSLSLSLSLSLSSDPILLIRTCSLSLLSSLFRVSFHELFLDCDTKRAPASQTQIVDARICIHFWMHEHAPQPHPPSTLQRHISCPQHSRLHVRSHVRSRWHTHPSCLVARHIKQPLSRANGCTTAALHVTMFQAQTTCLCVPYVCAPLVRPHILSVTIGTRRHSCMCAPWSLDEQEIEFAPRPNTRFIHGI